MYASGVDPEKADVYWVSNHYRWIAWKLASMERRFPEQYGGQALTRERVLAQLRRRYETEVVNGRKSALWKVLAGDLPAEQLLILCVSSVDDRSGTRVHLFDGWYEIKAELDQGLAHFVRTGKIAVGSKLAVCGATLRNSTKSPGHPLDLLRPSTEDETSPTSSPPAPPPAPRPESDAHERNGTNNAPVNHGPPTLSLHVNGTRRARWDAKLGQNRQVTISASLGSIIPGGGLVPSTEFVVVRAYPVKYRVYVGTSESPTYLFESQELVASEAHNKRQLDMVEGAESSFAEEVNKELDEERPEVVDKISKSSEPDLLYETLDPDDQREVRDWHKAERAIRERVYRERTEQLLSAPEMRRKATPFVRYRIQSTRGPRTDVAALTVWGRPDGGVEYLPEGSHWHVRNLATATNEVMGLTHLQSTPATQWEQSIAAPVASASIASPPSLETFEPRSLISSREVAESWRPACREVDMVLCVACIVASADTVGSTIVLVDSSSPVLIKLQCPGPPERGDPWSVKLGDVLALRNLDLTLFDEAQGVLAGKWHERVEKAKVVGSKASLRYLVPAYRSLKEWARCAEGIRALDFAKRRFLAATVKAAAGPLSSTPMLWPPTAMGKGVASVIGIARGEGAAAHQLMAILEDGRCVVKCQLDIYLLWKLLHALSSCRQPSVTGGLASCVGRLRALATGETKNEAAAEAGPQAEIKAETDAEMKAGDVAMAIASLAVEAPDTAVQFWRLLGSACGLAQLEFKVCFADSESTPVAVDIMLAV